MIRSSRRVGSNRKQRKWLNATSRRLVLDLVNVLVVHLLKLSCLWSLLRCFVDIDFRILAALYRVKRHRLVLSINCKRLSTESVRVSFRE
jgi:hypothetical protein